MRQRQQFPADQPVTVQVQDSNAIAIQNAQDGTDSQQIAIDSGANVDGDANFNIVQPDDTADA